MKSAEERIAEAVDRLFVVVQDLRQAASDYKPCCPTLAEKVEQNCTKVRRTIKDLTETGE